MDRIFFTFTLSDALSGEVADWIQLLPKGEFMAVDGRGPFMADEAAILAASKGRKLAIDINHAIDLKGALGEPSPAVGWIVELAARLDGIWGRVEWTQAGKAVLANREYGSISPVLISTKVGKGEIAHVHEIARASLCNDPALPQLKSLFSGKMFNRDGEEAMDKELREMLGMPENVKDVAVLNAVEALLASSKASREEKAATASLMTRLRDLAKLDEKADDDKIVAALTEKFTSLEKQATTSGVGDAAGAAVNVASAAEKSTMEKQIAELNARLVEVTQAQAREKAEAFVNKAIERFQIVPSLGEHFIARHIKEPELVEKEIAAMPALMSAGLKDYATHEKGSGDGLSMDERRLCQLMGVDAKKFAETKKATRGVER